MSKNITNDENNNQKSSNDNRNENENHNLQPKKDQEQKISNYKECDGAGEESSSSSSSLVLSPVPSSFNNSNSSSIITIIKHENNEENEDVFLTPHSSQIVNLDGNNNHHVIHLKEKTCEKGDDEMTGKKLIEKGLTSIQFSNQQQSSRISPLMATDDDDDDDDDDDNDKQNSTMLSFQFNNESENPKTNAHGSSTTLIPTCTPTNNNTPSSEFFSIEKESFKASISTKASPFLLPSWIALSLTLDGRDKITKVIQYTSRLLGYYYEELAAVAAGGEGEANMATATISRNIYYSFKAKKFRNLYKAMASSRKAYRFGRTLIELEKLKSMGLIHWIAWYLRESMFMETRNKFEKGNENVDNHQDNSSAVRFHPNTTFQNEQKGGGGSNNSNSSTNQKPSASYPPPINLKRQTSSNVGFKPSILHKNVNETSYVQKLPYLGKFLYKSLSAAVNEEKYLHKAPSSSSSLPQSPPPPPLWKILSSAIKLLGLAGFWAGDNIAYLYSIGFLVGDDANKTKKRKNNAALFATKCYFLAAVAGLYLNSREWHHHRNGPIKQVMDDISKLKMKQNVKKSNKRSSDDADSGGDGDNNDGVTAALSSDRQNLCELEKLEMKFKEMKHKHFKVCLALLKSCCDVAVFSNNSGVDLHLKYRGRKMNEGFQCVCGVISALTVIFNNYPSVRKGKF